MSKNAELILKNLAAGKLSKMKDLMMGMLSAKAIKKIDSMKADVAKKIFTPKP